MKFSIIIPSYNEAENLPRLLSSLEAAKNQYEVDVIVVDNCSTDDTLCMAEEFGAMIIQPEKKVKISQLRNLGAENALHDFLIFLDADMEAPPDLFEHVIREFSTPGTDAFGFVEDIPEEAPWFAKIWSRRTLARRATRRQIDFLPGRNIFIRKSLFEKVGGLSSALKTSEDKDLVMRAGAAGGGVYTIPPIGLVHWGYEKSFPEWCRKEFWRQHSHLAMMRRHGATMRIMRFPLLSLAHVFYTLTVLLLSLVAGPIWLIALPFVFVPGLAFAAIKPESRKSPSDLVSFTFLYGLRFHIAGVAFLSELFQLLSTRRADVS